MLGPMVCQRAHFDSDWFRHWSRIANEPAPNGVMYHRKQWELAAIQQSLSERGCLQPGKRGIGFAVGRERLVSAFASLGVDIVATDVGGETAKIWQETNQYAGSLQALHRPNIVDYPTFLRHASFKFVDMNDLSEIESDAFDFCWSTCSFEHLGSLRKGADFVVNAMRVLKPGGVAVHTTEFNVSSEIYTAETGDPVIYRRSDINELVSRLRANGHSVPEVDFSRGEAREDYQFDIIPFYTYGRQHIKLEMHGFVATSILLIATKGGGGGLSSLATRREGGLSRLVKDTLSKFRRAGG